MESSSHDTDGNTNASDAANNGVVHVTIPRAHGNWGGDHIGDEDFIETLSLDLGGVIGDGYENAAGAGRITEADASGDGDGGGSGGSDGSGDGQDANPAPGDQVNGIDPSDGESASGEGDGLPSTGDEGWLPIAFGALAIAAFLAALGAMYARRGR